MNIETLRDYLNSLNLDEVYPFVEIVYHSEFGTVCEDMADFSLIVPDNGMPYLSICTESFVEDLERFEKDKEKDDEI